MYNQNLLSLVLSIQIKHSRKLCVKRHSFLFFQIVTIEVADEREKLSKAPNVGITGCLAILLVSRIHIVVRYKL